MIIMKFPSNNEMNPKVSQTSLIQSNDDAGHLLEKDIKIKEIEKKIKPCLKNLIFVPLMIFIANFIVWMCFTFPENFEMDQTALTSFYLGSFFIGVLWIILIGLDYLLQSIPFFVGILIIKSQNEKISPTFFDKIIVFQRISAELSLALTLLIGILSYRSIFITYKDVFNAAEALSGSQGKQSIYQELLEKGKGVIFSKLLVGLAWIFFLILPGEIFTAASSIKFHGENLDRRVFDWNETFTIIKVLNRYTKMNASRKTDEVDAEWDYNSGNGMTKDEIATMSQAIIERYSIDGIFITLENISPLKMELKNAGVVGFLKEDEADIAYRLLDKDNDGCLSEFDIKEIIEYILEKKEKLQNCISVNNVLIKKLEMVTFVPGFCVGILMAMVILLDKGTSWTTHVGSFLIGLSSISRQCMTRLIDVMVFVFSEHCFDIHDLVIIDNKELEVINVYMFSTVFLKQDGGIVYMPNNILRTTNIINISRSSLQRDNFFFNLSAPLAMGSLCELKNAIDEEMRVNYNNFVGTKTRRMEDNLLKLDMNWEVSTFDVYKGIERSCRKRREEVLERLKLIIQKMEIKNLQVSQHSN